MSRSSASLCSSTSLTSSSHLSSIHSLIVGETDSSDAVSNGDDSADGCSISETSFHESELATSFTMETVTSSRSCSIVSNADSDACQFYVTVQNDDEAKAVATPGVTPAAPEIYSDDESIKLSAWPTNTNTSRKASSPGATKKGPVLKTLAGALAASMDSVEIDFIGDLGIVENGANPLAKVPEEEKAPSDAEASSSAADCASSLIDPFEEDSEEYRSLSCKSLQKLNLEAKHSESEESSGSFQRGFPYASAGAILEAFEKKLKRVKRQFPEATVEYIISKYAPRFPPEVGELLRLMDTFDTRIYESSDDEYDYPLHYARKTQGNSISSSSTESASVKSRTESLIESELDEPLASEDSQSVASEAEKASQSEVTQSEDSQSEASEPLVSQSSVSEPKVDQPKAEKADISVVAVESKQPPVRTQQYYPDSGSPRPNPSAGLGAAPSGGSPTPWSRNPPPPPNTTDHGNLPAASGYGQNYSGYQQDPSNSGYSRRGRGTGDRFNGPNSRGGGSGRPGAHRDRSTFEARPARRSVANKDRLGSEFEPTVLEPKPSYQIQNQHQSRSNAGTQWTEYQDRSLPPGENQSNLQNRQSLNRRTSRGAGGNEGVTRGGRGARFSDCRQKKN